MKKLFLYVSFSIALISSSYGQGTIRGKITDTSGEPLIGTSIVLKEYPTVGTISDFDGNYSLTVNSSEPVTLVVHYISYKTTEQTVQLTNGEVRNENFQMIPSATELEDVVVTARANRENDSYMRSIKLKSAISLDYISKETIKRTGDSRVVDAIKRVAGVSTIGGFITVRGLADRYVVTTINGTRIPTLDPLTNNIKLDMFPTALIDNLVITKTLSPDLPANWAGSYISIETKDYPDDLSISIKSSFGFNTRSTFRTIVTSQRSSTDWLGFDDGLRDIKHMDSENFPYYDPNPSAFEEFGVLGLHDYLVHSLGINEDHINDKTGLYAGNIYYRLGLIRLGYLAPGHIYNDKEAEQAKQEYFYSDKQQAFEMLNAGAEEFASVMSNTWLTDRRSGPVNFSQDITIGDQVSFLGKPLGFIAGIRYSSSVQHDPVTLINSYNFEPANGGFVAYTNLHRESTIETNGWSALINASYKPSLNHSVSMTFMPNQIGINKARVDSGYSYSGYINHGFEYVIKHDQRYESRKQYVYQFRSTHYFPYPKLKLNLVASYTDGESNSPDYRKISYGGIDTIDYGMYKTGPVFHPSREYRYLDEDMFDSFLTGEIPIMQKPGLSRKIKLGIAYFSNLRASSQYLYYIRGTEGNYELTDMEAYLGPESFRIKEDAYGVRSMEHRYSYEYSPIDFGVGERSVASGFGMFDFAINDRIRIAGGIRAEKSEIFSDIRLYHELGYEPGDVGREYPSNSGPINLKNKTADPASISELNWLPSINLIYKLREDENAVVNTRFNYSKSIARPSVREVSPFWAFDYEQNVFLLGNPQLELTYIDNFDARIESYFSDRGNASLSVFYKKFINHIEMSNEGNITWRNAPEGTVFGIELEGRKTLFRDLLVGANLIYIYSNATIKFFSLDGTPAGTINRQLYGQAPYVVNGMISYNPANLGLSSTLTYNVQGPRLYLASRFASTPDIFELPRHLLDFKISKKLGNHFSVDLKIRNLLNAPYTRAHDGDGELLPSYSKDSERFKIKAMFNRIFNGERRYPWDTIYDSYAFGTSFILGISYNL